MDSFPFQSFIQSTLQSGQNLSSVSCVLGNQIKMISKARGVVEVQPPEPRGAVLISCGIHGDETAGIELVDLMIREIYEQKFLPRMKMLFIFAHPEATKVGQRFIDHDLNRLFSLETKNEICFCESKLKNQLLALTTAFFEGLDASLPKWHFDLHCSIRSSLHPMFAVIPISSHVRDLRPLLSFANEAALDAVVFSRTPSSTFSWWTGEVLNVQSATFELGALHPLYQNDLTIVHPFKKAIEKMASENNFSSNLPPDFPFYIVNRTLIKSSPAFQFYFEDNVKNFTFFPCNTPIAKDELGKFVAKKNGESILFPNANVDIGLRAVLLLSHHIIDMSKPVQIFPHDEN